MRLIVTAAILIGACGTPQTKPTPTRLPIGDAAVPDAPHVRAPQKVVGHLIMFHHNELWPTRVCVDGADLVFENDCGCNDRILCQVDRVANGTLYISLRKDPERMPMCDDCFAMIAGRCTIPAGDQWTVAINGHAAFELPVDNHGHGADPRDGDCWTSEP